MPIIIHEINMNKYSGSNFDDFLAEEGILEEVSAIPSRTVSTFVRSRLPKLLSIPALLAGRPAV